MYVIIILSVIAIFLINLIFIDKIYKIIDNPVEQVKLPKKNIDVSLREALILGDGEICRNISDLLNRQNIASDILNDIDEIDKSYPYKYVLAVFNDDLENLTVCSIAINMMGINNTLAICNKKYNQKIYDENKIITLNSCASALDIVSLLLNYQNKREA